MIPESSRSSRPSIVRSSRWTLIGTVLSKPLQLGTNLMLARMLGPAAFGSLSLANVAAVTFSGMAGLGMGEAAGKFIAEHFRRDRARAARMASLILWSSVLVGTFAIAVAWLFRDLWAPRVLHITGGDSAVVLCLLLGAGNLMFSLTVNMFTGLQLFRQVTIISVLQASLAFLFTGALAYQYGVVGALSAAVFSSVVCIVWAMRELHSIDRGLLEFPSRGALRDLRQVLHFSVPSWLSVFVINPINVFTFSYLALQPGGAHGLGEFNTANGFKMLIAMMPGLIGSAIAPALIEESARRDEPKAYETLLDNALTALAFLTVPLAIFLILLSDLVFVIYGPGYAGSYGLFMPLAAGVALAVLSTPMQIAIVARSHTWWLLWMTTAKSLVLLGLAIWWVPGHLSAGLAWAWFVAELTFSIFVTEFSAGRLLAPRNASYVFYRYAAVIVLTLAVGVLAPPVVRWSAACPAAAFAIFLIVRRHPVSAVWIVGSLPAPLQGPAQRGLAILT